MQELSQRLDQLPDLMAQARTLSPDNPYQILSALKTDARNSKRSYKVGIPFRHFVTCSTKEHTFPEIKYEGTIFDSRGETTFTILASEIHEHRTHKEHP